MQVGYEKKHLGHENGEPQAITLISWHQAYSQTEYRILEFDSSRSRKSVTMFENCFIQILFSNCLVFFSSQKCYKVAFCPKLKVIIPKYRGKTKFLVCLVLIRGQWHSTLKWRRPFLSQEKSNEIKRKLPKITRKTCSWTLVTFNFTFYKSSSLGNCCTSRDYSGISAAAYLYGCLLKMFSS